MAISQQLCDDNDLTPEQKEVLVNRQNELDKLVSKYEGKAANTGLHPNFALDLETELDIRNAFHSEKDHLGKIEHV